MGLALESNIANIVSNLCVYMPRGFVVFVMSGVLRNISVAESRLVPKLLSEKYRSSEVQR